MIPFGAITVEDGGQNSPPLPVDNTNVWTAQLLDRATQPDTAVPYNGKIITETVSQFDGSIVGSIGTRTMPLLPNTGRTDPIVPDQSGGVTINPNPPVNDAQRTPTPINQLTGTRLPAPTHPVLQSLTAAVTNPKLTRDEIIALLVLAALVIL